MSAQIELWADLFSCDPVASQNTPRGHVISRTVKRFDDDRLAIPKTD